MKRPAQGITRNASAKRRRHPEAFLTHRPLIHSFDSLLKSSVLEERLGVLAHEQFWTDLSIQALSDPVLPVESEIKGTLDGLGEELCKVDCLEYCVPEGKCDAEMSLSSATMRLAINGDSVGMGDFEQLPYLDVASCTVLRRLLHDKELHMDYHQFMVVLRRVVALQHLAQASIVIEVFLSNDYSRQSLEPGLAQELLELLIRLNLDPVFYSLCKDMVSLLKVVLGDQNRDCIVQVTEKMRSIFIGFPFRALTTGNFLALASNDAASVFYDCLLFDGCMDSPGSFLARLSLELDEWLTGECDDYLKFAERLLLVSGRLATTDDLPQDELVRLNSTLRQIKGHLPRGIVVITLAVHDAIIRISSFLMATCHPLVRR